LAYDPETLSRPRPSPIVEYRDVAYSLRTIIEKLRREGVPLPQSGSETDARRLEAQPWLRAIISEGPCVCCHTAVAECRPDSEWPWVYLITTSVRIMLTGFTRPAVFVVSQVLRPAHTR